MLRRFFRVPTGKFVDDFFGVSAEGVQLGGGQCLDALGRLVGLPPKDIKSVSFARTMCILGAILSFVPKPLALKLAVDPAKAEKWAMILIKIARAKICTQRTAIKMAGRLVVCCLRNDGASRQGLPEGVLRPSQCTTSSRASFRAPGARVALVGAVFGLLPFSLLAMLG